jgi:hypothetical protein
VQPHEPPADSRAADEEGEEEAAPLPLRPAKTENCTVRFSLAHFGQLILPSFESTTRS